MKPLLTIDQLAASFRLEDRQQLQAVNGISFAVQESEIVALVGESGSGKSVTALAIMGLLPPDIARINSGRIVFDGVDLLSATSEYRRRLRGKEMAMIFQDPMSALNPVFTIKTQIIETLALHLNLRGSAAYQRMCALLAEVGMQDIERIAHSYPHQLSGGQQQRVMIAMALATHPKLIIADEPTTALDVTIQKQILQLLVGLQKSYRMAVLFITHDLALVREIAQRVVVMRHGQIREIGAVPEIFNQPVDAYTRALLACRPPTHGHAYRLPVLADFLDEGTNSSLPEITSAAVDISSKNINNINDVKNNKNIRNINDINNVTDNIPPNKLATIDDLTVCGAKSAEDPMMTEAIQPYFAVQNLNTLLGKADFWGRKPAHIIKDVSFDIGKGQTLGIVGASGSGKTTLGLSLLRLYPATGAVMLEGRNILPLSEREFMPYRRRLQIIFQNPLGSLNPRFTIGTLLTEPMRIHGIGEDKAVRKASALSLLDQVGIPQSAWNRYPHEFSGGQCQRIAIARCLTLNPEILICDESVSALDVSIQAQILNLLKELQERYRLTYLFISHDLNVVRYLSHQIIVMNHGAVVESGAADQVFNQPQHSYTKTLLAAIPGNPVTGTPEYAPPEIL